MMRREWLTALITAVHAESRGAYGSRRVRAELVQGRGIGVSERLVWRLMHDAGIHGLPGPAKARRTRGVPTGDDLVERQFARSGLNELWVADITEHPTAGGKVYCCAVKDLFSNRIVGYAVAERMTADLAVGALRAAIARRRPDGVVIVHADRGAQFRARSFQAVLRSAGLQGSMGRVASAGDNAAMESFWAPAQRPELPDLANPRGPALRDRALDRAHLQPPPAPATPRQTHPRRIRASLHPHQRPGSSLTGSTRVNRTDSKPPAGRRRVVAAAYDLGGAVPPSSSLWRTATWTPKCRASSLLSPGSLP